MRTIKSLDDEQALARTIWGEARGETFVGRICVANVIINRLKKRPRYGSSVRSVCLKPWQFSCWNEKDPNRAKLLSVEKHDAIFQECLVLSKLANMRALHDMVNGSAHYHAKHVKPKWAKGLEPVTVIGNHVFYNNVP